MSDTDRRWLVVDKTGDFCGDAGPGRLAWITPMTRADANVLAERLPGRRVVEAFDLLRQMDAPAAADDCAPPSSHATQEDDQ